MICAAIFYMIDQNEPSPPYLVELACSDDPTKEELVAAAAAHHLIGFDNSEDDEDYHIPTVEETVKTAEFGHAYGDLAIGDDPYTFFGLPDHLRKKFCPELFCHELTN